MVLYLHQKKQESCDEWDYVIAGKEAVPVVFAYLQYAELLLQENKIGKAVEVLESGFRSYPGNRDILYTLLPVLFYTGDVEKSIMYVQYLPDGFEKDQYMMKLLCAVGQFESAYKIGQKWRLKLSTEMLKNKNIQPFWQNYVNSLIFLEKTQELKEEAEKYLQVYPDDLMILNGAGYVFADQNIHLDLAETYLKKARELQPDSAAIADSLAWLYHRQGKMEEAKKEIFQALILMDSELNVEILEHAGDILMSGGNDQAAVVYWNMALSALGNVPEDHEQKQRLQRKIKGIAGDQSV